MATADVQRQEGAYGGNSIMIRRIGDRWLESSGTFVAPKLSFWSDPTHNTAKNLSDFFLFRRNKTRFSRAIRRDSRRRYVIPAYYSVLTLF